MSVLQNGFRQREPRVRVIVPCRMNHNGGWLDACIHNVSSRGMLVASDGSVKSGDYIDIRRGTLVIIGRVVWAKDRFFGVRTQDRISVDALVGEPRRATRPPAAVEAPGERRSATRYASEAQAAHRAERSRQMSSFMQYGLLVCVALIVALAAGSHVYGLLDQSMGSVSAALGGQSSTAGPAHAPQAPNGN
ncbi:PilZ domain-containing protein [Sphingomonas gellani]|uniref:PilZ domain-containing protein n=1 Tax=Sphingomonas gellani TaxID=1166340 RepID=UPI0011139115|nr:PilZ domain-containing protein [Sphingomonas gellani]